MNKDINWFVWKPSKSDEYFGFKVDMNCCRYSVNDTFAGFHQCVRKGKETIEGYKFCTQHAKMISSGKEYYE